MTCYQRHILWLFEALDLEYEKGTRRRVDEAIRAELDIPESAHCPEVWSAIKALSEGERTALVPNVGARLHSEE